MAIDAGLVIIGAGQAALQLAMSLRAAGDRRAITLIGEEPYAPYSRPPLSKSFLKGNSHLEDLFFRHEDWFFENGVALRLSQSAVAIDRARRCIQIQSDTLSYETLVLATGARPRTLADLPETLGNAAMLRGIGDIRKLHELLPSSERVAVIGGGFIGLEFAAMMRGMGHNVTLIEAAPRLMGRTVSPAISDWFAALHRSHGVDLYLSTGLAGVEHDCERVQALNLTNGIHVPTDLVLMGVGVVPNDALAKDAGLECDNGIAVDGRLRTSDPSIYAIGDCASFPMPDGSRMRLESVQNAVDQAKHLARVLGGETASYAATPWFWSDQYDVKLQIAGLLPAHADAAIPADEVKFSLDHVTDGILHCRESVNDPRAHLKARKAVGKTAADE
jgi:3-phenylpropionate/trans-cinnamate dioxygenase ferredoxin reductase subunit